MDEPLVPKSMSNTTRMLLVGTVVAAGLFTLSVFAYTLIAGASYMGAWPVMAVALIVMFIVLLLLYRVTVAGEIPEEAKLMPFLMVQYFGMVFLAASILGAMVHPIPRYVAGGSIAGLLGSGMEVTLDVDGTVLSTQTSGGTCGMFLFSAPNPEKDNKFLPVELEHNEKANARVTMKAQPSESNCVTTGSMSGITADYVNFIVNCTKGWHLGGRIEGLSALSPTSGVVVTSSFGAQYGAMADTPSFRFSTVVRNGAQYTISIGKQPLPKGSCTVASGAAGTAYQDVNDIVVRCS